MRTTYFCSFGDVMVTQVTTRFGSPSWLEIVMYMTSRSDEDSYHVRRTTHYQLTAGCGFANPGWKVAVGVMNGRRGGAESVAVIFYVC